MSEMFPGGILAAIESALLPMMKALFGDNCYRVEWRGDKFVRNYYMFGLEEDV